MPPIQQRATVAGELASLVAADGATGGFLKDSDVASLISGYLYGLTLSNNGSDATNDIDIAAGKCIDSTNAVLMSVSALTKRLDAGWAAGTNQGMRNSGAAITDTTYHIYAVCKAAGADPDIYAHASATVATVITALQAETGGSAYLYARRIGSIIRSGATILAFVQTGDKFLLATPVSNFVTNNPGTSAVTATATTPGGIVTEAILGMRMQDASPAAATFLYVSALAQADAAPDGTIYVLTMGAAGAGVPQGTAGVIRVSTNTSSQYRYRLDASTADHFVCGATQGWTDTRGRLA